MPNTKTIKRLRNNDLVMETLDAVLPNAKLYIMNDDGGTMKYLPLQPVESTKQTTPPVAPETESEKGSGQ